ncbi:MAG TPA: 2'-5' RNA ligase family protein [Frankiaceae bacterium]|nr:2'-5' RNA ligase family protein [Frankiaceae bacterium]
MSGPASGPESGRSVGVTIELPEPYGSELAAWRARLGDPSAEKIPPHITLLPPTAAAGDVLAKFVDHLTGVAAAHQPFRVRLLGTGTFRPVSPVVFVVVVEGAEGCAEVQADVRAGPIARELHFPYHPHVTVAHDLPEPQLDFALTALADYEAEFEAQGFALFERDRDGYWHPGREFRFGHPGSDSP